MFDPRRRWQAPCVLLGVLERLGVMTRRRLRGRTVAQSRDCPRRRKLDARWGESDRQVGARSHVLGNFSVTFQPFFPIGV